MLASEIITRARVILQDADAVRWPDSELIGWINDGQRVIALVRPDASVSLSALSLVAGTKQSLPSDALRLLDVVRNLDSSNNGGRVVRHVDRDVLDTQNVNWHSEVGQVVIKNYVYDNRNPKTFYVYPPATTSSKVEIAYSKIPADVANSGSALSVSDIYFDPLLNYVLYRAYSKDAEFSGSQSLAGGYLQIFQNLLGLKTSKDAAFSPDLNSRGKTTAAYQGLSMGGV